MKKYNRSEIMKRAWELRREGKSKSSSLKLAWKEAKSIRTSELKKGDVVKIEWGDWGNMLTCTIESVSNDLYLGKYFIINAVSTNGTNVEFCSAPTELLQVA